MIGQTISHYKIIEKLGAGGMGEVYKTEDTRLQRMVALKFLPPEWTRDPDAKARFLHEAQAASKLDHLNICTVYEINETDDGQLFIAMAYYDGQTLRELIDVGARRAVPLPLDKAIDIASQIAQGLQRAHEAVIIHRDIKPANIMITDRDEVKIVDFGLAKAAGRTQLTKEGSTLGTVAYMSPEQARGEQTDHCTDIWSLGVVLYEMLTGRLPFDAEYDQAVLYSICHEAPAPITGLRTGVPIELEQIVNKCLEKDAANRYQHVDEVLVDLRRVSEISSTKRTGSQPATKRKVKPAFLWPALIVSAIVLAIAGYFLPGTDAESTERIPIAVADFVNQTGEAELDGLSELLVTSLEQSRRLAVLPRASMYGMLSRLGKDSITTFDEQLVREICERANVNTMATAFIRKLGQVYAIDLKILDLEQNKYLLTHNDRANGQKNIFPMLDRLSEKIRRELREKQTEIAAANKAVAAVTTTNFEAYSHYFQGMQLYYQFNMVGSERELNRAIAIDSTFGPAYVRLLMVSSWAFTKVNVKQTLRKAFELVDRMPEKERYLLRAMAAARQDSVPIWERQQTAFSILKEMEKAYPDDKDMLYLLGRYGDSDSIAIHYLERVLTIDPKSGLVTEQLIDLYFKTGGYEKARVVIEKSETPDFWYLYRYYVATGRIEEGIIHLRKAWELFPDDAAIPHNIAGRYFLDDNYDEAEKILNDEQKVSNSHSAFSWHFTELHASYIYTGRYRKALEVADQAIEWSLTNSLENTEIYVAANFYLFKALTIMLGWGDKDAARKQVEEANRFEHPYFALHAYNSILIGDYRGAERAYAVEGRNIDSSLWITLMDIQEGKCQRAIQKVGNNLNRDTRVLLLGIKSLLLYHLSFCYFEQGQAEKAIEALRHVQVLERYYIPRIWLRPFYYPKSFYALGKIYEQQGDTLRAIENYEKFLDLWKKADEDLPELIDAKARNARLKGE